MPKLYSWSLIAVGQYLIWWNAVVYSVRAVELATDDAVFALELSDYDVITIDRARQKVH